MNSLVMDGRWGNNYFGLERRSAAMWKKPKLAKVELTSLPNTSLCAKKRRNPTAEASTLVARRTIGMSRRSIQHSSQVKALRNDKGMRLVGCDTVDQNQER